MLSSIRKGYYLVLFLSVGIVAIVVDGCNSIAQNEKAEIKTDTVPKSNAPEYYSLRPALEKSFGYTHAVKIGDDLKISGAVSMNEKGELLASGDIEQQMKNCYKDLEKILHHHGYTFQDVYAENIYTTDMRDFEKVSSFRNSIYTKQFPTGTWLEVKGLALVGQLIEIDMEARRRQ